MPHMMVAGRPEKRALNLRLKYHSAMQLYVPWSINTKRPAEGDAVHVIQVLCTITVYS